jgi:tRNA (uracil-5-)-methyltransferase
LLRSVLTDDFARIAADDYPAASLGIYKLMPRLLEHLDGHGQLSAGVRAVHFLTVKEGDQCVITLIYDEPLKDSWREAARALMVAMGSGVSVQGRSKGRHLVEGSGAVMERLSVENGPSCRIVVYKQVEGSFSNPNPHVNEKVLSWLSSSADAISAYEGATDTHSHNPAALTLLELYCGNGNHTCALACKFRRIVGVEINPILCQAADENLRLNGIENVQIFCSPSAAFCSSMLREKRLVSAAHDGHGADVEFDSVLVDPPRAGLDEPTVQAVTHYAHILYISCGPDALKRDLNLLCRTHQVIRFAAFDHFPFTRHIESAVYLRRRR